MSRIGRRPVAVPKGVSVELKGREMQVKGPKGTLQFEVPDRVTIEVADGQVRFARGDDKTTTRALHGMARARVNNMVTGVTAGFARELEIQGVGYRAEAKGKQLNLLLGFSHPVTMDVPAGLSVSVDQNTRIKIEGIDKQLVGQFAANVRSLRPPEPYKGKGVRYLGERVRRKVGKAGAS